MPNVHISQEVPATAARIFQACSDPEHISRWQADEASGTSGPGGRLRLRWPVLGTHVDLTVTESVAPERLVVRSGATEVSFEVEPGRLTLTQLGIGSEDEAEGVASAWRLSLSILSHYLAHHDGHQRTVEWVLRPVSTTPGAAHVFFSDRIALDAWLTRGSTGIGEVGSPYSQRLASGIQMSGQVLANTPGRDVALSWVEQENSVLSLRTLPSPLHADERMLVVSWSRWSETPLPVTVVKELGDALDRLVRILSRSSQV
jgi:uncharacterized protein YndB with AHSA1/START domain